MNRLIYPDLSHKHIQAFFTGKDPGADIQMISKILKIREEKIYMPIQKHTDKIIMLEASFEPQIGDAVITKEKGVLIGVQVADCVPILIHEKEKGVIAAIHAGWRGTAAGILKKTIKSIADRFICRTDAFSVMIGPSIRSCCYGVDHDVFNAVRNATAVEGFFRKRDDKYFLDLAIANKLQALSMGIPERNICVSRECTSCSPDRFYSYRFAKGPTGRQGGFIGMLG